MTEQYSQGLLTVLMDTTDQYSRTSDCHYEEDDNEKDEEWCIVDNEKDEEGEVSMQ